MTFLKEQIVIRLRIVLINFILLLIGLTLVYTFQETKALIFTVVLVYSCLALTHEKKKLFAIIQWGYTILYTSFLGFIMLTEWKNVVILIGTTFLMVLCLLARLRKE